MQLDEITRERLRIEALARLQILDTPNEPDFDALIQLAKNALGAKIALVSLIDERRQWFKAVCGLTITETPIEQSFCAYAVEDETPLVVPDARLDPRFASNPLVTGAPFIRFYAGVPFRAKIGHDGDGSVAIGTICVIDDSPRDLTAREFDTLKSLAVIAETLVDARAFAVKARRLAIERQTYIQQLDREHRQFKQAERIANIGSWRLTLADHQIYWSNQVFAIHELPAGHMPPLEAALNFYPPPARATISAAVARTIETGEPYEVETDFVTAKGNMRRVRSIGELETIDGTPVALIGVFQDVTEQHRLELSLRHKANTDDLTQIPNRAAFNRALDKAIERARSTGEDLALLLIDLDGFKMVNDRCGHQAGDDLLQRVGQRLQAPYLSKCFVARLGGDEFVVIVRSKEDHARLAWIVETLLGDLRHAVSHRDGAIEVSGTIGISWLGADHDRGELVHRADTALYEAKHEQRGSARTFTRRDDNPVRLTRHKKRR